MHYKCSLVDAGYNVLKNNNKELDFATLFVQVCDYLEITSEEEKDEIVSYFYTELSVDGRFVTLGENVWDLRARHTFDKVHIDMNDVYADIEEDEDKEERIEKFDEDDEDGDLSESNLHHEDEEEDEEEDI